MIWAAVALSAAAMVAAILFLRRYETRRWRSKEPLPQELAGARLWASEKEFRCNRPIRLRGRVDQVYRTRERILVPVETKRRQRQVVYESDRLQLSQYRLLLLHRFAAIFMPTAVAGYGYVRLVTPEGLHYERVELMTTEEVARVYDRYLDIMSGKTKPHYCDAIRFCDSCAYRQYCPRFGGSPTIARIKHGARTVGRGIAQAFRR
jgi:CRISPR/Cas system-associated exonuclease Cas4 (RecB family)